MASTLHCVDDAVIINYFVKSFVWLTGGGGGGGTMQNWANVIANEVEQSR